MDLAAYLTSVLAVCGIALGAMYLIVNLLGKRIDDLGSHVNSRFDDLDRRFDDMGASVHQRFDDMGTSVHQRFDDMGTSVHQRFDEASALTNQRFDEASALTNQRFDGVERRLDRLEAQNDSIIGAVSDLGQRVTRLETGHA